MVSCCTSDFCVVFLSVSAPFLTSCEPFLSQPNISKSRDPVCLENPNTPAGQPGSTVSAKQVLPPALSSPRGGREVGVGGRGECWSLSGPGQTRAFTGETQLGTQKAEQKPIWASREPPSQGAHPYCREESGGQAPPAGGNGLCGETKPRLLRRQWVTHDNI